MSLIDSMTLGKIMYNETNFYHMLIDINVSYAPTVYHQCYNDVERNDIIQGPAVLL